METNMNWQDIFNEAQQAAEKAFDECKPIPMVIGQAKDLFSNEIVPGTEEFVADGVCGFAWVNIKPARGPFVKFLKQNNLGRNGVYGGWTISMYDISRRAGYSQSMQRKEAACRAFVQVIKNYAPDMSIWMESRMD